MPEIFFPLLRSSFEAFSRYLGQMPGMRSVPALVRDVTWRIPRQLNSFLVDGSNSVKRLMRLQPGQRTPKRTTRLSAVDPALMPVVGSKVHCLIIRPNQITITSSNENNSISPLVKHVLVREWIYLCSPK